MNHHLRDATKMISKTPRTDRQPYITAGFNQFVKIGFARQLERQLAGANERIKRLEEDLMDAKNKHAALVADVALYEDRGERIKELEAKVNELNDLKKWLEGR
jgi:hypothetical protein